MKYLIVINPVAGGVDHTEEIRSKVTAAFQSRTNDSYEIYITKYKGDETRVVREYAETGEAFRVIACGGDGTFNGCCNGAAYHNNIAVSPFPTGTGNDFCRMFGDQKDLYRDLNAILDGTTHPIDLALVNGLYCTCIASCGFDARIGCNVHNYTHLPLCKGTGGYIVSLIVELIHGMTMNMKVTCEDFFYEGAATLCCICNGRHYGGGFNPSPDAMPDDGILDIYFVKKVSFMNFLTKIGKYKNGKADETGMVDHLRSDRISLEFDTETIINCDGEALHDTKVDVRLHHNCMNLIVPKGLTFFGEQNNNA